MNISEFHARNLNKSKPITHRLNRNRPKPVNTFAQVLCEMLYRATPIEVLDNVRKKYYIDLGNTFAVITASITSQFDEAPMYEIEEVVFQCAYNNACTDCPTEHFDIITYG